MVSFAWLNLAEPVFPAAATNTLDLDIIFCRNVMIYFSGDVITGVTNRFFQSLVKGGILIVSPADMTPHISDKFSRTLFQGYTIYQKIPEKEKNIHDHVPSGTDFLYLTELFSPVQDIRSDIHAGESTGFPSGISQNINFELPANNLEVKPVFFPETEKQESLRNLLSEAKRMANQGKHEEAARLCSDILKRDKSDYQVYYLLATIWMEMGMTEESIGALNKVIYLEKDFVMAHYLLGKLSRQAGNVPAGEKALRNLQKLLLKTDPSAVIPESGGLTASGFLELIKADLTTYAVKP
jgi:chemotaxis protein methyltransferase CheR